MVATNGTPQGGANAKSNLKGNRSKNLYVLEGHTIGGDVNVSRSQEEIKYLRHG